MAQRVVRSLLALLLVAVAATLAVVLPASASTVRYSHSWSPPLNLPSNYRPCCPSTAGFTTLPFSMNVYGNQKATLTVRMKTNWVDYKAVSGTPNIIQQGRVAHPIEMKIFIHSGPNSFDHHGQCRIEGSNGIIVQAHGPKSIDVADGKWHTIVCIKAADNTVAGAVLVVVDGVPGPVFHTRPLGNLISSDPVDLGGQGTKANKDSIDGQYASVTYTVG